MPLLKLLLDRKFPAVSKTYRQFRDDWRFKHLKPYQTLFGFQLYGDSHLDSSRSDDGEIDIFLRYARQADVVIDAGANVGLFACLAAQQKLQVLAFEPDKNNLQCLYRNLETNGFSGVEVFPIALSDAPGICPLFGGGQGATLLRGWGAIESNYQRLSPVNTLDNLVHGRFTNRRLLIKVDVEGNEFRLLQGARRLLEMTPAPVWLLEHGLTENFGDSLNPHFADVFDTFWNAGYKAFAVDRDLKLVEREDIARWIEDKKRGFGTINYLFIHHSHPKPGNEVEAAQASRGR